MAVIHLLDSWWGASKEARAAYKIFSAPWKTSRLTLTIILAL